MNHGTPLGIDAPGLKSGRLRAEAYAEQFGDSTPALTDRQAVVEADRCHYCFDAPCARACPTDIDVPSFIHRIAQHNVRGAAHAILSENILGGMCGRVCPTDTLCEQACVRKTQEGLPVQIGKLQRYAVDQYLADPGQPLFTRAADTGKRIAIVGAGPAGLAAAHRLATQGHELVVYDAHTKPGGLNEYGLAAYKTPEDFAQREIDWLLSIGHITLKQEHLLGRDITLAQLREEFDAVFLGMGLAGVNALGIEALPLEGVEEAVDFIAALRQSPHLNQVEVGRSVVVIGGGMTAVDAAVQAKKLGARDVTMVYRRGESDLKASVHEREWAQTNGVTLRYWSVPNALQGEAGHVTGITFDVVTQRDGALLPTGEQFTLAADMVLKAIGQTFDATPLGDTIRLHQGRIVVDEEGHTSLPGVWAGGDCCVGGLDLTVDAVRQGKAAAQSIDTALQTPASPFTTRQEVNHG